MAASSDTVVTEEKLSTSSTRRPGLSFCLDFFLISVRSIMKLVQIIYEGSVRSIKRYF